MVNRPRPLRAADLLYEAELVCRESLEPKVPVERGGSVVDSLDDDELCRRLAIRRYRPAKGIPEQLRTKAEQRDP